MRGLMRGARADRGTVTAETAVVLPVLLLVAWIVLALIQLAAAQLACQDAARAAARAASRGETAAVVVETAQLAAPQGAAVSMTNDGDLLVVEVTARPRLAGPLPLPGFPVTGRAVTVPEPMAAQGP